MAKVSKTSTDPRVRRTRQMLRQAILSLLEKKHFDSITVTEITAAAGLNPATFYLHYEDKWDLLNGIVSELSALVDQQPDIVFTQARDGDGEVSVLEVQLFEHIARYRDFYRLMLGRNGVASVRHELEAQFRRITHIVLSQLPASFEAVDVPQELVEYYYAGAYVAVIQWWLNQPGPVTPQQLARWMETLWRAMSDESLTLVFRYLE